MPVVKQSSPERKIPVQPSVLETVVASWPRRGLLWAAETHWGPEADIPRIRADPVAYDINRWIIKGYGLVVPGASLENYIDRSLAVIIDAFTALLPSLVPLEGMEFWYLMTRITRHVNKITEGAVRDAIVHVAHARARWLLGTKVRPRGNRSACVTAIERLRTTVGRNCIFVRPVIQRMKMRAQLGPVGEALTRDFLCGEELGTLEQYECKIEAEKLSSEMQALTLDQKERGEKR